MPAIDLDVPLPTAPPKRRRRALLVGAGVVALAVGAGLVRLLAPTPPVGPIDLRPEWSHDLPLELGEAVAARVKGETVLVVGGNGLLALDRGTGAERWQLNLGAEIAGAMPGGLTAGNAWDYVRVSGNSLVLPRFAEELTSFDVIDLPTGEIRFSVPVVPSGEDVYPTMHLTPNALVVLDDDIAAHALTDGRELWRREVPPGTWVTLPADLSYGRQPTGIANPGPSFAEPVGGIYLENRGFDVEVRSIDDGGLLATWSVEGVDVMEVVAGAIVMTDSGLTALDRGTGTPTWSNDWLSGGLELPPGPRWALVDGLLMDVPPGSRGCRLIDLDTGEVAAFDVEGRKVVFCGGGFVVGIDSELAALTAFGSESWTTSLRPEGWTASGFRSEGVLTGGGWLVLGGELGFGGEVQRHVWVVELATGRVGSLPDGVLVGFENGGLVSVTGGGTVQLHELGV